MANKTTKTQLRNFDKNFIEAGRDITNGVVDSVKKDLLQQGVNTAWKRFLGDFSDMNSKDTQNGVKEGPVASGDLREGEELDLVIKTEWAKVEPALNYMDSYRNDVLHFEERGTREENRELKAKIEEIKTELIKLSESSSELEVEFKDIAIQTLPQNPGKYHLNFFEWVLVTIRNARMRIEDSAAWVSVVSGKKNKKNYWNLAKQHGTSFSLSGERVVAQQTG